MWLIADSGSTKTQWVLYNSANGNKEFIETIGMNPYFIDDITIEQVITLEINPLIRKPIKHIYFYGAGCLAVENKYKLKTVFGKLFSTASISIETDMLGAARGLAGKDQGIICILGTGANACVYDGNTIIENGTSIGYILGDEGSGAYIGKLLARAFLNNDLPDDLKMLFEKQYSITRDDIITNVYRKPFPNRYLASFMPFVSKNKKHPFLNTMVEDAFTLFFQLQIEKLSMKNKLPIYFTGSIAFYFQEELKIVAQRLGYFIGHIEKAPLQGLIAYHGNE